MALDEFEKNILRKWQSQGRPLVSSSLHKIVCTLEMGGETKSFEPVADGAGRYSWQFERLAMEAEFKLTIVAIDHEGNELKSVVISEKVARDEIVVSL